jgi:hypothetical protein
VEERDLLEDLDVDVRIILKCILEEYGGKTGTSSGLL